MKRIQNLPQSPFRAHPANAPPSEMEAPSSNRIQEKLESLKTQPGQATAQKKLTEIQPPAPNPPKIVRFYWCRGDEGDPLPSIEETEWECNPQQSRVPDKNNTIYEYYRSVDRSQPKNEVKESEDRHGF